MGATKLVCSSFYYFPRSSFFFLRDSLSWTSSNGDKKNIKFPAVKTYSSFCFVFEKKGLRPSSQGDYRVFAIFLIHWGGKQWASKPSNDVRVFLCSIVLLSIFLGCGRNPRRTLAGQPKHGGVGGDVVEARTRHGRQPRDRGGHLSTSGRPFFDEKQTTRNVTLIKGQTAHFHCVVRNVGNKSVSGESKDTKERSRSRRLLARPPAANELINRKGGTRNQLLRRKKPPPTSSSSCPINCLQSRAGAGEKRKLFVSARAGGVGWRRSRAARCLAASPHSVREL